ncbi:hypothetical protein [Sorangium sp. So ce394]|uniref:hypothetical protein n=1 Tax=Sorangium sp. So ce394 TaxID=3133310 RepID=UPI003F5C13EA
MPQPFEKVDARLTLRVLKRLKLDLRAVLAEAALGYTATEIAVGFRKTHTRRWDGSTAAEGGFAKRSAAGA